MNVIPIAISIRGDATKVIPPERIGTIKATIRIAIPRDSLVFVTNFDRIGREYYPAKVLLRCYSTKEDIWPLPTHFNF